MKDLETTPEPKHNTVNYKYKQTIYTVHIITHQ